MQSATGIHSLALFAAILASGIAGRLSGAELTAERPWNFVILLADDLGWSDLACYGADLHQTPISIGWPASRSDSPTPMRPLPCARPRGHRS